MRKERKGEKINLFKEHIKTGNLCITCSMHGSSDGFILIHGNGSTGSRKGKRIVAGLSVD